MWDFPLFPEQASTVAGDVDALYFFLVAITAFFTLLIAGVIVFFAIKYRRGNKVNRSNPLSESKAMEAVWIGVPLVIALAIFFWGVDVFFTLSRPPRQAQDIYVVGKQWMWKFQHLGGQREINNLHIPVGQPVRLIMTSQDVIHSLFVPAFRVKQDVLPGRYTQLWFQATKPGTYHLFCTEYCGLEHSGMIGKVTVMEQAEYEQWLRSGGVSSGATSGEPLAQSGERIFQAQGCGSCHMADDITRAPQLRGLFNQPVKLRDNETVVADEQYIRESILRPMAKIVQGYEPLMPVYQGRINEEDLLQLVAYIKSLGGVQGAGAHSQGGAANQQGTTTRQGGSTQQGGGTQQGTAGQSAQGTANAQSGGTTAPATPGANETSGNK